MCNSFLSQNFSFLLLRWEELCQTKTPVFTDFNQSLAIRLLLESNIFVTFVTFVTLAGCTRSFINWQTWLEGEQKQ